MNSEEMKDIICKAMGEKKSYDITVIDVSGSTSLADYFIICSAKSAPQVKAIAANVDERLSKNFETEPLHRDGITEGRWIVLDYGAVIVHVFREDMRELYALEKLWDNGTNVTHYED